MDMILALIVGVVVGALGMVASVRRAAKKPDGKTAKIVNKLTS